ncbi:MAG: glycosyltransferase family 1 protein [Acidobacteriaceae bacterium]
MRILIAAPSFSSEISGLQRHALNLARCLLLRPEIRELHFALAPWQSGFVEGTGLVDDSRFVTHIADLRGGSLDRNLWYYRRLPEMARRLDADLVHLSFPMPVDRSAFRCPTVVTLHDLYPYEIPMNFGFPKFLLNRVALRQCLRNIDAVACVSDITVARLRQYFPAAAARAVRIYNCIEAIASSAGDSPIPGWNGEPFFLAVAQHRRNKNLSLQIRAFHRLLRSGHIAPVTRLLIVGIRGPETARLHKLVARLRLTSHVCFLQGISDAELQWCYRHCEALVSPSVTEGFGLPVAEGILAGCRIVASDIPAHREIGDGVCTLVRLRNNPEQTLADAMLAVLGEPKPQPEKLPQFSASLLANQYVSLYRRLLAGSTTSRATNRAIGLAASERQSL